MRKRLESATEKQKRKWLENFKPMLSRAFYGRYGLYPAGSEALKHIDDLLHEVPEIVTAVSGSQGASAMISTSPATTSRAPNWRCPAACGQTVLDRRFTGAVHRYEERAAVHQGAAA
jgi:hypothetical protein